MRKVSLIVAIAMVISLVAAFGASAHVNGTRDQKEWTVPHINANNPVINFDGVVDTEGEWKGAVDVVIDFRFDNPDYEEITLWPVGVWSSGAWDPGSYDEFDEKWEMTIHTYFLWDEAGLYIATKCDNAKIGPRGPWSWPEYGQYAFGEIEGYEGIAGIDFEPMICPTDAADAYVNNEGGKWPMFIMGTTPAGGAAWLDGDVISWSGDANPDAITAAVKHGQTATMTADADGYYHFSQEIFLPWEYINGVADEDGNVTSIANIGTAGTVFTAGLIYDYRTADEEETRLSYSNAAGWSNYDFYMLSATPAEDAGVTVSEPAVEEPAVEEPTVEEPTVEEPAVEEPTVDEPTPAPTPAPSNPSTADVSVIFYALAALSAVGGISVFKRK